MSGTIRIEQVRIDLLDIIRVPAHAPEFNVGTIRFLSAEAGWQVTMQHPELEFVQHYATRELALEQTARYADFIYVLDDTPRLDVPESAPPGEEAPA